MSARRSPIKLCQPRILKLEPEARNGETLSPVQLNPSNLSQARRAAALGTLVSGTLAAVKIVAGVVAHSSAMIADGVESAGDSITGLVVLYGLAESVQPPDEEHPYGHTRAEDIAGKTVSTIMLISGVILLQTNAWALFQLLRGEETTEAPHAWTLWLMLGAMAVKAILFGMKLQVGRKLRSSSLVADAWNDFTDVLSAASVVVGLFFAQRGVLWADRAAAIVVALLILYTARQLSKAASAALLDQQAPPEVLNELRRLALSVPNVAGVEKLFARRSGLMYFVDMHLEVDGAMPVRDAHDIGHRVKDLLQKSRPDIADVLIHLEPAPKKG